ncbi:MAG: hypothetical protein ACPG1C_02040 [Alphaproteobacteria bacterium]
MREIDEFELLLPWEDSKFLSGPGTVPAKDVGFPKRLEREARKAMAAHPIAAARLKDLSRRGQTLSRSSRFQFAIEAQFKTHFGYLVIFDKLSERRFWDLPGIRIYRTELWIGTHYRAVTEKELKDYNSLSMKRRQYRLMWGAARFEPQDKFVSPVVATRIIDNWSIEMDLMDGSSFRVTVMDNAKKGFMYTWLNALYLKRDYPPAFDPTHLRIKRLRRGRKIVWGA